MAQNLLSARIVRVTKRRRAVAVGKRGDQEITILLPFQACCKVLKGHDGPVYSKRPQHEIRPRRDDRVMILLQRKEGPKGPVAEHWWFSPRELSNQRRLERRNKSQQPQPAAQ